MREVGGTRFMGTSPAPGAQRPQGAKKVKVDCQGAFSESDRRGASRTAGGARGAGRSESVGGARFERAGFKSVARWARSRISRHCFISAGRWTRIDEMIDLMTPIRVAGWARSRISRHEPGAPTASPDEPGTPTASPDEPGTATARRSLRLDHAGREQRKASV